MTAPPNCTVTPSDSTGKDAAAPGKDAAALNKDAAAPKEPARGGGYSPPLKTLSGRQTKLALLLFFGTIFAFAWVMTKGNKDGLDELRKAGNAKQSFYQVEGVPSGDSLLVVSVMRSGDSFIRRFFKKLKGLEDTIVESDPPQVVRLIGVQAPPMQDGPTVAAFADRVGLEADALLEPRSVTKKHYGEIARDALKVYIYKQRIRLTVPDPARPDLVYAEANNVDLGMVVLQHGQAAALPGEHEFAEEYQQFEAQAKRQRLGLWDR